MKTKYLCLLACTIAMLWAPSNKLPLEAASQQQPASESAIAQQRALVDKYCVTCHNQKSKTAGLSLDTADFVRPSNSGDVWEKVIRKLRAEMMPPVGAARPDKPSLDALASYLET